MDKNSLQGLTLAQAGADQHSIRDNNIHLILRIIEEEGPLSRAEIGEMVNISAPTISSIVDELEEKNLIRELEPAASSGGRKPIPLEFNAGAGYVVGIDVGGTNIEIGLSDLEGEIVSSTTFAAETIGSGREAVSRLAELVERVIGSSSIGREQVRCVGLGVPGVTDVEEGRVSLAPAFYWHELPIRDMLKEELDMAVAIENDVNAAAYAEKRYGRGQEYSHFIFISVGTGIGAGVILDDRLHRGHSFAAGEVGYTIIDLDWIEERQEQKEQHEEQVEDFGCLESSAAAPAIVDRARRLGFDFNGDVSAYEVLRRAENGDEVAGRVLDEVTDHLAAGIINSSLIINPEAVFLGGGIFEAGDTILKPIRRKVKSSSPLELELYISSFGHEASLRGAISIAADQARVSLL